MVQFLGFPFILFPQSLVELSAYVHYVLFVSGPTIIGLDVFAANTNTGEFTSALMEGGDKAPQPGVFPQHPVGNCSTYVFEWFHFCVKYEVVRYRGLSFS